MVATCTLLVVASLHLFLETFGGALPPASAHALSVINWPPAVLLTLCAAPLAYLLYGGMRALRPRPSLCITHALDEDAGRFEFWYRPGENRALDTIVDQLFALSKPAKADPGEYQVSTGYTRRHVRPLRALLLGACAMTFMLLLLVNLAELAYETYTQHNLRLQPVFFAIFLLPWAFALLLYGIERVRMRLEPVRFRMGLRHYHRKEFEKAERRFMDVLREAPDHVPTLYLLTRLTAHRFDFERAFRFCRQLGRLAPEQAEALQEDIWTLKRLRGRMASRQDTPPPSVDVAGHGGVE